MSDQQQQTPTALDPATMTRDQFNAALREARESGGKEARDLFGYAGNPQDFGSYLEQVKTTAAQAKAQREQAERELAAVSAQATTAKAAVARSIERAMAGLTPEQRQAVQERAGDDLVKQAEALELLHAAGLTTAPRRQAQASTPPAPPKAPQSAWQTWRQMQAADPRSAARFYEQHRIAINNSSPNK